MNDKSPVSPAPVDAGEANLVSAPVETGETNTGRTDALKPRYEIVGDMLCEWTDKCTCGGYCEPYWMHEKGCGLEPAIPLDQLPALLSATSPGGVASPDTGNGSGELRDQLADLLDAAFERNHTASLDSIEAWDFDVDLLPTADAILAAGWRPPLPKMDVDSVRSQVGALIDEIAFHDDDRDTALEVAQALIDGGWLDRSGVFGEPEPVAHTLRRVIQDLESEAMFRDPVRMIGAYPERSADDVIAARALSEYAERLRKHPSLTGEPVPPPAVDALRAEIRAVLDEWDTNVEATHRGGLEAVRRILDRDPSPLPDSETERLHNHLVECGRDWTRVTRAAGLIADDTPDDVVAAIERMTNDRDEIRGVLARWQQYLALPIKVMDERVGADSLFANIGEILDSPASPPKGETQREGCCTACDGTGNAGGYPCEDCYATGHCHGDDVTCSGQARAERGEQS